MTDEKLFSDDLAEQLYRFAEQKDVYHDLCEKVKENDMSIAEYVSRYRRDDFVEFLKREGVI